jgi:hypothetical protein
VFLAKLNDLTVPLIDELAKEIGVIFESGDKKADKINKIKASNVSQSQLEDYIQKYISLKKEGKKSKKDLISELKGRIRLLEEQVKFLMSKISVSDVKISKENDREMIMITSDLRDIKKFIKSIINPGESISIDELIEMKEIQKIPLITLKHAVYDLIDDGIFDTMEGDSRQKIGGKIGILIRK